MIYKTFKADTVESAINAVCLHILPNFDQRYGKTFTKPNCQNIRLLLESDYDCPKDIIEECMIALDETDIIEYMPDIWDII